MPTHSRDHALVPTPAEMRDEKPPIEALVCLALADPRVLALAASVNHAHSWYRAYASNPATASEARAMQATLHEIGPRLDALLADIPGAGHYSFSWGSQLTASVLGATRRTIGEP